MNDIDNNHGLEINEINEIANYNGLHQFINSPTHTRFFFYKKPSEGSSTKSFLFLDQKYVIFSTKSFLT